MSQASNADMEYRLSCQKFLESLIARRDFRAAARYYDSIAESLEGRTDLTTGIITRLGAKAFGSSGNLQKALSTIRTSLSIITRSGGEIDQLGEGYLDLAQILRELGNLPEAIKAYRDAESIFRRNDNFEEAGTALNRLAGVYYRKGEFDASLSCLLEALEYAREENDLGKLAFLYGNLGRVYTFLGRLDEAAKQLQFNIDLSSELDDITELARAYLSLGYVYTQQSEFNGAEEAFASAAEYIEKAKLEKEQIIYLTYSGELLLKMKQYDGAEYMLNTAHKQASKTSKESFLAARPLRHLAELSIARRNFRRALQIANKALAMMKRIENDVEIGAVKKIIAVCHANLDESEKAKALFRDAISILDENKARFELADAIASAGQSGVFTAQQSLIYLCRAEEIFKASGNMKKSLDAQKQIGSVTIEMDDNAPENAIIESVAEFPTRNPGMKKIALQMSLLTRTDLPILLTGETGTGKDFMAQRYHKMARPENPYVAINCAAVPDTLLESELFGYQKGAFTGADANRQGLFMAANGGVLLLDEVGEMPLPLQAKLLSVLETRKMRPLGTSDEIDLDILILAATNCDLAEMVNEGTFRQDLYYRLAGITFELIPLRDRKEDIPFLLEHFMKQRGLLKDGQKVDSELIKMFVDFDWPGNVRQLENKVKQLSAMAEMAKDGSIVELSRPFFESSKTEETGSLFDQVEQFERRLLLQALVTANGNKSEAARILSIHESTFRAKMKKYGLELAAG